MLGGGAGEIGGCRERSMESEGVSLGSLDRNVSDVRLGEARQKPIRVGREQTDPGGVVVGVLKRSVLNDSSRLVRARMPHAGWCGGRGVAKVAAPIPIAVSDLYFRANREMGWPGCRLSRLLVGDLFRSARVLFARQTSLGRFCSGRLFCGYSVPGGSE